MLPIHYTLPTCDKLMQILLIMAAFLFGHGMAMAAVWYDKAVPAHGHIQDHSPLAAL